MSIIITTIIYIFSGSKVMTNNEYDVYYYTCSMLCLSETDYYLYLCMCNITNMCFVQLTITIIKSHDLHKITTILYVLNTDHLLFWNALMIYISLYI